MISFRIPTIQTIFGAILNCLLVKRDGQIIDSFIPSSRHGYDVRADLEGKQGGESCLGLAWNMQRSKCHANHIQYGMGLPCSGMGNA